MPREIIAGADYEPSILVGWSRDQYMQVGLEVAATIQTDGPSDRVTPLTIATTLWGHEDTHEAIGRYLAGHDKVGDIVRALVHAEDDSDAEAEGMRLVGRLVVEALDNHQPGMEGYRSLWWNPTRHQVNTLIRLLRKARDAAFGRDE